MVSTAFIYSSDDNLSFPVDADLNNRDSSEEIACARELLTLGQNSVKRPLPHTPPPTHGVQYKTLPRQQRSQRVIVEVPSVQRGLQHSHPGSLNLDGNASASDTEEEDETRSFCKIISLSEVLLCRNSSPKSTVEDSCLQYPAVLNTSNKKSFYRNKKTRSSRSEKSEIISRCDALKEGSRPLPPELSQVKPCIVSLSRLPAMSGTLRLLPDTLSDPSDSHPREPSQCGVVDNTCDTIMITSMSSVAPTSTFIQTGPQLPAPQGTTYIMAPGQPQGQVLVFSGGGPTFSNTGGSMVTSAGLPGGSIVTSAGLQGNLVLVSAGPNPFPGQAVQMVPMSKGLMGPQTISVQPDGNVIKVPVGLNGGMGGMVIPGGVTLPQSPGIVTLSQPLATLQPQPQTFTLNQPAASSLMAQSSQVLLQPATAPAATMEPQAAQADDGKVEPTYKEDGSVEWSCRVCFKVCATEHELAIHKKRHKIAAALICPHCQRSYVDQHRYAVHVRIHTGETPYHCDLCGKGFRDDRKMKLHMARHNSGLSHKCHLCPRSFEGPKALEKHLKAHALGRYVAPKVIQREDGSVAMALPDDPNQAKKEDGSSIGDMLPQSGGGGKDDDSGTESPIQPTSEASEISSNQITLPNLGVVDHLNELQCLPNVDTEGGDSGPSDSGMISLSVDDLYQYSVAQTDMAPENVDIHDQLSEGSSKIVPLGMDEFMTGSAAETSHRLLPSLGEDVKVKVHTPVKLEKKPIAVNESGEFPDLLDSDNGLDGLQHSNFDYAHYDESDDKLTQLLKGSDAMKEEIKEESGLTFATLSGLDPVYPEVDLATMSAKPVVVAKRSRAPAQETVFMRNDVETIKSEVEAMHPQLTLAPLGMVQTLVQPQPQTVLAPQDPSNLTFTIQYDIHNQPSSTLQPQMVAQQPLGQDNSDDEDDEEEEEEDYDPPTVQLDLGSTSSGRTSSPRPLKAADIKPILHPPDPDKPDPTKDCFTYTTKTGVKIEVPTIITSGYDFDNLLCLFCDNQQFKNDKTLINHLLNHFGVAPKMATCPICNLSLQKKSFARHVRLHGDVQPEVCPYCKKEFREKRSLDKHIRAIHEAERPYPCDHCSESFRNQIELKNHINRHMKDYPFRCDVCSMTFQKQEALSTHYRLHTGDKPYICPICEKRFTSEKNKRVHVLRHQGSLPHKCEECDMTFQSRSHLMKHATSHNRKTQVISAKINTFLESFGASLGDFGMDDNYEGVGNDISIHSATEAGEIEDASIRLSVDNLPDPDNLESAAAEAAFAFGNDFDFDEDDEPEFVTPEPPGMPVLASNTGSAPSLVNGLSEEEAEKIAKAELATEIPNTADGTYLCTMCNTKLGNKRSYIIHLRRHAGMLNFKCKYCPKTFQGRVKLNRHMNTHSRDGSNTTPPPSTSTINTTALLPPAHPEPTTTMADGKLIFNCAMCSKAFTDKQTLQEHTKMHLIEDAKAKFSMSGSSKEKRPEVGRGQMKYSYTCNLCSQTFFDNEKWKLHKTSHGNKTWKCKFCETLFEDRAVLSNHLHEIHNVGRDEMESMGLLKAIPLVIIKAVTDNSSLDVKEGEEDSEDDDSEPEVDNPMPKHFDNTDEAFFEPLNTRSRSNSPTSLLGLEGTNLEVRPTSACTDNSDTSMNVSFDNPGEVDESNFDPNTLTCKLCNKVLKNMRTFRNHKARHMGTLSHKCPDCNKCFEGRSAVNRHLVSNHNRELQPHEITTNPAAIMPGSIKPTAPEIKLFKPSEMARKSFQPHQAQFDASGPTAGHSQAKTHVLKGRETIFDGIVTGKKSVAENVGLGQMPILLENPTQEVRYLVGAQHGGDFNQPAKEATDFEADNIVTSKPASPRKQETVKSPTKENIGHAEEESEERGSSPPPSVDRLVSTTLIPKLANIEKIIPESDNSSNSDKSDSDSSSSSDTSSDSEVLITKKKTGKKNPEEITIEDDDEVNDKSSNSKFHKAFQGFVQKAKKKGSDSETEGNSSARKKRTKPVSKKVQNCSNSAEDDITIYDPVAGEKKTKKKTSAKKKAKSASLSEGESSHGEGEILRLAEEAAKPAKKKRGRPPKKTPDVKEPKADKSDKSDKEDKPEEKSTRSKAVSKVSMVAAIFRAKKANKGKEKVLDEGKSKVKKLVSESESEKEKDTDGTDIDKETQEENDKLMEQKGVKVVGDKMMIPADKLKIPDELCKIKSIGRGKAGKKMFVCQICDKQFNRADKMKYHLYNEHYDDFIRCSDSVPRILKKAYSPRLDRTPPQDKKVEEKKEKVAVVSKPSALARIFKKKGPKKPMPIKEIMKAKEESSIEQQKEDPVSTKQEVLETLEDEPSSDMKPMQVNIPKLASGISITAVKQELLQVDTKEVDSKRNKSPRGRPPKSPVSAGKSPRGRPPKSPRGDSLSPGLARSPGAVSISVYVNSPAVSSKSPVSAASSPKAGGRSPRASNPELVISPVVSSQPALLSPTLSNTSIILSPKASFTLESPKLSETVHLEKREDEEEPKEEVPTVPTKLPLISKAVSLQPRDLEANLAPVTNFPFASMGEPKFGANADLVTFADLAMKSKAQAAKGFASKSGTQLQKAKKIERKKVSARISLEQSNIEDTQTLIDLRAARDEEDEEERKSKDLEGTKLIQIQDEEKKSMEVEEVEEKPDARVTAALEEASGNADEFRPTRSRLQVDAIGLSSSTLDLELHALRSLVFNDILGEGVDEFNIQNSVRTEAEVEEEELAELAMNQSIKDTIDEDLLEEFVEEEDDEEVDSDDLPEETRTHSERFHDIRQKFPKVASAIASKIWHERKHLRLKRSKELRALLSQQPEENRAKYKPHRQDFSLELLCGNNFFDNTIIEADKILRVISTQLDIVKENKIFMKPKIQYARSLVSGQELKMIIHKRVIESPHGVFKATVGNDHKLVIKRVRPLRKILREKKLRTAVKQSMEFNDGTTKAEPNIETPTAMDQEVDVEELSPRSILKETSQYDSILEGLKGKTKTPKKLTVVKKFKVSKVTWGATPPPHDKKKKRKKIVEMTEPTDGSDPVPRVKRKYTKRKNLGEAEKDQIAEEAPRVKRKYTKRKKVDDSDDALATPLDPVESTGQSGSAPEPTQPGDQSEIKVKRKYTKRKKPEDDSQENTEEKLPKKRGRPKMIKASQSGTEDLKAEITKSTSSQSEAKEAILEDDLQIEGARSPKDNPTKVTEEGLTKSQELDKKPLTKSNTEDHKDVGPTTSRKEIKEWSTEVLENVSKGVFDFEDNDDSTTINAAHSFQSKGSKMEEDGSPLKVKRFETSSNSGDEQQVPLKITFKRPKQTEEEKRSNQPRKSIKLKVKTQTTKDHGLKIQIRQPKTDNPLKFKVKTTKSKKIKRNDTITTATAGTTPALPTKLTSAASPQISVTPTATTPTSATPTATAPTKTTPTAMAPTQENGGLNLKVEGTPVLPQNSAKISRHLTPSEIKTDKLVETSLTEMQKDVKASEKVEEEAIQVDIQIGSKLSAEECQAEQVHEESPNSETDSLLIKKGSGLSQICSLYSDDDDSEEEEDDEPIAVEDQTIAVHPALRPPKTEEINSDVESKIGQLDGFDDLTDLSDEEDGEMNQLDGSYDGFYKVSPGKVTKVISSGSKSSVLVLAPTTNTDSQSTNSSMTPAPSTSSTSNTSAPVPGQIKRDRSVSDDGQEDGDNPSKKKHQCHICQKLFPNSFRLKTHVRVHTGEKPFKCEPCAQAFADRSNYVKHKQTKTHRNKVEGAVGMATGGGSSLLGSQKLEGHLVSEHRLPTPQTNSSRVVISHYGESGPPQLDNSREVPQFDFLDSPGTPFNQHDLDSYVPIDGYDTDDSLPMTFEDMDDVSLATEQYMFSSQLDGVYDSEEDEGIFGSQVDGEQDLLEPPTKKPNPGLPHQNGIAGPGVAVKVETLTTGLGQGVQLLVNGNSSSESSILARHLGLVVAKASPRPESPELVYSCDMCSAKLKNKRNFETHMKRHRGELPFKCEECPKTFQGRRDLETHKRSRHDPTRKGIVVERDDSDLDMAQPILLSPSALSNNRHMNGQKTIILNMNHLPNGFLNEHMNTILIKQDPVMVANHKDEPPDPDTDFILQDSLPLFDNSLMESSDSAVNLSLDDLTSFAQPLGGSLSSGGLHQDNSFDASMDGSASFLSGADMSTDTFEMVGEEEGEVMGHGSNHDPRNDSGGGHSPFTPRSGSATPSLPDEGEFPCPQCDKRFGNRRNLMSHMRRHTGDYKLFCESCGKGFFTQSKLDSHKRKHTGEKPFRCLFTTCLKRFRYKGDLSKHIKRYHPGHQQPLTPVALQEDEIAALANAHQAAKQKTVVVTSAPLAPASAMATSAPSTLRTVLTTGLRPNQLVLQPMQPPTYRLLSPPSNPATIIPDSDPSLDENLLNMLAADGEDDDPMLSPSTTAKTLAGLTSSNTALALPNTVFSSKPVSNQDVGVFLQSSGKSTSSQPVQLQPITKTVILSSNSQEHNGQPALTNRTTRFVLPQSSFSTLLSSSPSLATTATSSTTLRSLLSCSPESLPMSQALRLSPVRSKPCLLTTTFSPSPKMTQSFLPADISFTSDSSRESGILSLPSDSVTLTLEDIMSCSQLPPLKDLRDQQSSSGCVSDRDSDLTSPGSVRSEMEMGGGSGLEGGALGEERLACQFPQCGRTFDRSNLLKRHLKLHSGEARFVCDVCKKSFESGSKLEDHYRRHTGERPFQCHVCGNKFRYKGDRTKHLKNLHGIHKSIDLVSTNGTSSEPTFPPTPAPAPPHITHPAATQDKTPFMPSITEETSSSISSFQSNPEMSDGTSLSGSTVGESPTKFDPLEVDKMEVGLGSVSASTARPTSDPNVAMSIDEVMAYAQPMGDINF